MDSNLSSAPEKLARLATGLFVTDRDFLGAGVTESLPGAVDESRLPMLSSDTGDSTRREENQRVWR